MIKRIIAKLDRNDKKYYKDIKRIFAPISEEDCMKMMAKDFAAFDKKYSDRLKKVISKGDDLLLTSKFREKAAKIANGGKNGKM